MDFEISNLIEVKRDVWSQYIHWKLQLIARFIITNISLYPHEVKWAQYHVISWLWNPI
jgi:hypothetical protein